DAVEAREQRPPQRVLLRRPSGYEVVRGEDGGDAWPEEHPIDLGGGQPLEVEDVRRPAEQGERGGNVLDQLERDACPRAVEEAGGERVVELAPPVARRLRHVPEPEARRHELDVEPVLRERSGKLMVV